MSLPLQNINTYTYSPGFQLGQYHNAVLCISGNVQNLYLDGNLIATKTGTTNILSNYSNINQILIGCAGDKSSGFSGYLDDFRIYNYTLNQTQVSNLYINRNIVAYYPFDNSLNGQTPNYVTLAYDASFVGNAATISTSSQIGNGSLQLTNTNTAGSVKSYVTSSSGFSTSATNGISVSLWFKTTGVSATRMRLFDLCKSLGSQGISVDISGTNGIVVENYNPVSVSVSVSGYITDFTTGTPNGHITNSTIFDGWTASVPANTIMYSNAAFYGTSYADPTQSPSASGRNINFTISSGTGPLSISRSIYLYTNYTYALSFFIGTRTGQYYNSNNYFKSTITNGTSNSTPNPIFNITGMISTETKKTYTFTVPTSSNYTFSFIIGSAVSVIDSTYILRNVSIDVLVAGPIDSLSASAKNAMLYPGTGTTKQAGAYGVRVLYSGYTGPVMNIKRSTDNVTQDFYADAYGNLGTAFLGKGTSITTWLGAGNAVVMTWYDQTGNSNHGTAVNTPIYNTSTKTVSFTSGYFSLPNGAYPTGNLPYTYIYTPDNYTNTSVQIIHGGGSFNIGQSCLTYVVQPPTILGTSWWGGDFSVDTASTDVKGIKIAECYNGTVANNVKFYYNNAISTNMGFKGGAFNNITRSQTTGNNCLGHYPGSQYVFQYRGTLQFFYWAPMDLSVTSNDINVLCDT